MNGNMSSFFCLIKNSEYKMKRSCKKSPHKRKGSQGMRSFSCFRDNLYIPFCFYASQKKPLDLNSFRDLPYLFIKPQAKPSASLNGIYAY